MASQQGDNDPGASSRSDDGKPAANHQVNPTSTAAGRSDGNGGAGNPGETRDNPIDIDDDEESLDLNRLNPDQLKVLDDMKPFFQGLSAAQLLKALKDADFVLEAAIKLLADTVSAKLKQTLIDAGFFPTLAQCVEALENANYSLDDAAGSLANSNLSAAESTGSEDLTVRVDNLRANFPGRSRELLDTILQHSGGDINVAIDQIKALVAEGTIFNDTNRPTDDENIIQLMSMTGRGQKECVTMLENARWDVDLATQQYNEEIAKQGTTNHRNQADSTENDDDIAFDFETADDTPDFESESEPEDENNDDGNDGDDDSKPKSGPDDKPPPPPGGPPSAPQGKKEDEDKGDDDKKDEGGSGTRSKRKASGSAEAPNKRTRVGESSTDTLTKSISDILIKFDDNRPLKVQKSLLNKITFFQKILEASKGSSLHEPIECQMPTFAFRMIRDWVVTGQININEEIYPRPQLKLDAVVTFLGHAINLGVRVHQPPNVILGHIKEYLIENREALRASHIRLAFGYHKPGREPDILKFMDADEDVAFREAAWKPVREIFVNSATRLLVEHREDPFDVFHMGTVYTSDDEGINEARRDAFKRGFRYDREMEVIPEFQLQLLIMLEKTNRTRTDKVTKGGKTLAGCYFLDPLTMERFERD